MTQPDSISAIIPTHSGRTSVRKTVQALLANRNPNLEVIVVSDGAATMLRHILADVHDPRLAILEREKEGAAPARNAGLAAANGKWVAFVDDDDIPRPNWLQVWFDHIDASTAAVTAGVAKWSDGTHISQHMCRLEPSDPTMNASQILAGAFVVRRDLLNAVGGYDPALRAAQNQDLGLRLCDYLSTDRALGRVKAADEVVIDLYIQRAADRVARYGDSRADAARLFLIRYDNRLKKDPAHKASLYRIIARVDRLNGDYSAARRAALAAWRSAPLNLANLRSVALAFLSSLMAHSRFERWWSDYREAWFRGGKG